MTYEEIAANFPDEYEARAKDKLVRRDILLVSHKSDYRS